jgi:hypothetical protein
MTDFSLDLWGAAFQTISFLCLMAIPWCDGRLKLLVGVLAAAGLLSILGFQFYIGVKEQDYGLGGQLMLITLTNIVIYFAASWIVEKIFRLYLLKKREKNNRPPSG